MAVAAHLCRMSCCTASCSSSSFCCEMLYRFTRADGHSETGSCMQTTPSWNFLPPELHSCHSDSWHAFSVECMLSHITCPGLLHASAPQMSKLSKPTLITCQAAHLVGYTTSPDCWSCCALYANKPLKSCHA